MCNACGFFCCAYDGFSKCGCDHCPEPKCWDDDPDEYDDDDCELSAPAKPRFICVALPPSNGETP